MLHARCPALHFNKNIISSICCQDNCIVSWNLTTNLLPGDWLPNSECARVSRMVRLTATRRRSGLQHLSILFSISGTTKRGLCCKTQPGAALIGGQLGQVRGVLLCKLVSHANVSFCCWAPFCSDLSRKMSSDSEACRSDALQAAASQVSWCNVS